MIASWTTLSLDVLFFCLTIVTAQFFIFIFIFIFFWMSSISFITPSLHTDEALSHSSECMMIMKILNRKGYYSGLGVT